jgi:hypothetical protein
VSAAAPAPAPCMPTASRVRRADVMERDCGCDADGPGGLGQGLAGGLTRILAVELRCDGGGDGDAERLTEATVRDWFRLKMLLQVPRSPPSRNSQSSVSYQSVISRLSVSRQVVNGPQRPVKAERRSMQPRDVACLGVAAGQALTGLDCLAARQPSTAPRSQAADWPLV